MQEQTGNVTIEQLQAQEEKHLQSTFSTLEAVAMLRIAILEEEKAALSVKLSNFQDRLEKLEAKVEKQ